MHLNKNLLQYNNNNNNNNNNNSHPVCGTLLQKSWGGGGNNTIITPFYWFSVLCNRHCALSNPLIFSLVLIKVLMRQYYSHSTGNRGSGRMNNLCTVGIIGSPDQFQSPCPSPTLHCPSFHQHPCHSAQSRSSSLETSFRACTFHFIKYTFSFSHLLHSEHCRVCTYSPTFQRLPN